MNKLETAFRGKKAVVTGGLGFIGSNVARRLAELSSIVTVVDSLVPSQGGNRFNLDGLETSIDVQTVDVGDTNQIGPIIENCDYIFNLAALTSHISSIEQPLLDLEVNCVSQLAFLETLKEVNPDCTVVYTGSRCQYGQPTYLPVNEEHPLNSVDINGIHKTTVEMYHLLYSRICGFNCTCLRLSNVYGPRHQMKHSKQGFLHWFIRLALEGEDIQIFGDGAQKRDFLYVEDVVDAVLLAAAEPSCYGDVFNVGTGYPISIGQVAKYISDKSGCAFNAVEFPKNYLNIECGDVYLDSSKFRERTGWEQRYDFDTGLDLTLEFYREYRDRYWSCSHPEMVENQVSKTH